MLKIKTSWKKLLLTIFSLIPLGIGFSFFSFGVFCFFGGADARVWDPVGLKVWGISWAIAFVCAGAFLLMNLGKKLAWLVLLCIYELPLALFCFMLTLTAVISYLTGEFSGAPKNGHLAALGVMLFVAIIGAIAIFSLGRDLYRECEKGCI